MISYRLLGIKGAALVVACGWLLASSHSALADCSTDNPPTCIYAPNKGQVTTAAPKAFTFPASSTVLQCEQVTNNCTADVMVPMGSLAEWTSFLSYHESCVSLAGCALINVAINASPKNVLAGAPTNISWTITGGTGALTATSSSTDGTWSNQVYNYSSVPTSGVTGTVSVVPTPTSGNSTTYGLSVTDSYGDTGSNTVNVTVGQPLSISLTANPTSVLSGNSATLNYTVTDGSGLSISCAASSSDGSWATTYTGSTTLNGSAIVTPTANGTVTYTLNCNDDLQSSVVKTVQIQVGQPLSISLSANPSSVTLGSSTTLTYTVTDSSGLSFSCTVSSTDGTWSGSAVAGANTTMNGSNRVTPNPSNGATSVTYSLNCSDPLQSNVTQSVTVPVTVISTCNAATLTWGGNCSGTTPGNISVGASSGTINNTVANYVGSATATCGANGTWGAASGTCTQSVVTGIWWFWVHSLHGTGGHYSLEVGNVHNCVNGQYGTTIPSSCGQLPSCSTFTYDPTGTPCSYSGGSGGVTGVLTIPSSTCLSTLTACP